MNHETIAVEDSDGLEHELPTKLEVCPTCEGHGTHLTPSIRDHAYTMDEFRESFDDEEAEHYFRRGGMYDVQCEECHGRNVVAVVDRDKCTAEQLKLWDEHCEAEADYRACVAAERRMGA